MSSPATLRLTDNSIFIISNRNDGQDYKNEVQVVIKRNNPLKGFHLESCQSVNLLSSDLWAIRRHTDLYISCRCNNKLHKWNQFFNPVSTISGLPLVSSLFFVDINACVVLVVVHITHGNIISEIWGRSHITCTISPAEVIRRSNRLWASLQVCHLFKSENKGESDNYWLNCQLYMKGCY